MNRQPDAERDPRPHARKIREKLSDVVELARREVGEVRDPRAEALFETTAEVLQDLITAREHFEERAEEAWR